MQRELKFRAWDKRNGMTDCFCIHSQGCVAFKNNEWLDEKDKPIIMQYTGFQDKNGVDIYEEDIFYNTMYNWKGVVDDLTVAHWIIDEDRMNNPMRHIEVIGNIYENPELYRRIHE